MKLLRRTLIATAALVALGAQAAAIVGTLRQLPAQYILMTPRRYYAIASALDTSSRPLASPGQGPHPNDMPRAGGSLPVGPIIGIPCDLSGGVIGAVAEAERSADERDVDASSGGTSRRQDRSDSRWRVVVDEHLILDRVGNVRLRASLKRYVEY